MILTKKERVLRQFTREQVDHLPSQITFSDRSRDKEISEALGLDSPSQLDDFLENHILWTYTLDDVPLFYRNVADVLKDVEAKGFARVDREGKTVFDRWGRGVLIGDDGFFANYGVLRGDKEMNARARDFLPERLAELTELPLEKAVAAYEAPDPLTPGNCEWYERDSDPRGGYCVIPVGYNGIFETAYALFGFEQFMTEIAYRPTLVVNIMEKVTDYRMKLAKVKADLGYKIVHHGDDLAMQSGGFFSKRMFDEILMPQYKKLFAEYKRLGMFIFMHSCGQMMEYLPQLIDAGLDGWEPVQPCNDLEYVKREYGKDLVFMGGIDTQKLPFMNPAQVIDMTKEVITVLGKGGGYIIAPAQELMKDVPIENIVAILNTIKEMREAI
jgi:uroporphyrinogen decarboxylase